MLSFFMGLLGQHVHHITYLSNEQPVESIVYIQVQLLYDVPKRFDFFARVSSP